MPVRFLNYRNLFTTRVEERGFTSREEPRIDRNDLFSYELVDFSLPKEEREVIKYNARMVSKFFQKELQRVNVNLYEEEQAKLYNIILNNLTEIRLNNFEKEFIYNGFKEITNFIEDIADVELSEVYLEIFSRIVELLEEFFPYYSKVAAKGIGLQEIQKKYRAISQKISPYLPADKENCVSFCRELEKEICKSYINYDREIASSFQQYFACDEERLRLVRQVFAEEMDHPPLYKGEDGQQKSIKLGK